MTESNYERMARLIMNGRKDEPVKTALIPQKQAIETLREMIAEVWDQHRDSRHVNYNECNKPGEECAWCERTRAALAILSADGSVVETGAPKWKCGADRSGIGGNTPQDCDWPYCGCDETATKVIEALQEQGWAPGPARNRTWQEGFLACAELFERGAVSTLRETVTSINRAKQSAEEPSSPPSAAGVFPTEASSTREASGLATVGGDSSGKASVQHLTSCNLNYIDSMGEGCDCGAENGKG